MVKLDAVKQMPPPSVTGEFFFPGWGGGRGRDGTFLGEIVVVFFVGMLHTNIY